MITDLQRLYESGFRGYEPDARADAALESHIRSVGGYASAADAIDDYRLTDNGKGKLSLPYLAAESLYPHCLPGGAQGRGSCVAWSTRNAALVSYCAYLMYGENVERYARPDVSQTGIENGVFSTAGIYWFRRHGRDGWQCSSAAQVATTECGLLENKPYPHLGLDLTRYSASVEGKWGASLPPAEVRDECAKHLCGDATVARSWDEVRSLLGSGFGISTCGGESWSNTPDAEWGVSQRTSRGWAHALALIAADDRPETHERWGCGLVGVQNSWGNWMTRRAKVHGTRYQLPVGAFWSRWEDFKNRYCVALGPARGWQAVRLPDWGLGQVL